MNNIAQIRTFRLRAVQGTKLDSVVSTAYILPGLLTVNTVALLALDQLGGIPAWIKAAASLFLAF